MRMVKVARLHDGDIRFDSICPQEQARLLSYVADGTETRKVEILHVGVVGALPTVDATFCSVYCLHPEGARVPHIRAHVL